MNYSDKTKEELIDLIKYYKSENSILSASIRAKNKEINKLKNKVKELSKIIEETDEEQIEFLI